MLVLRGKLVSGLVLSAHPARHQTLASSGVAHGICDFLEAGLDNRSRAGSFAYVRWTGLPYPCHLAGSIWPQDLILSPKTGELLLGNHARAIDLFRARHHDAPSPVRSSGIRWKAGTAWLCFNIARWALTCNADGRDYEREIDSSLRPYGVVVMDLRL